MQKWECQDLGFLFVGAKHLIRVDPLNPVMTMISIFEDTTY